MTRLPRVTGREIIAALRKAGRKQRLGHLSRTPDDLAAAIRGQTEMCSAVELHAMSSSGRFFRAANFAVELTAGSHSLAAAAHRERSADKT